MGSGVSPILFGAVFMVVIFAIAIVFRRVEGGRIEALAKQLGGATIKRKGYSGFEIPSEFDGPVQFEIFYDDPTGDSSQKNTGVSVPIRLARPSHMSFLQKKDYKSAIYNKLRGIDTGPDGVPIFKGIGPAVEVSDRSFSERYFAFSDLTPEILNSVIASCSSAIMAAPPGIWSLEPEGAGAEGRHIVKVVINKPTFDVQVVNTMVGAVTTIAKSLRDSV